MIQVSSDLSEKIKQYDAKDWANLLTAYHSDGLNWALDWILQHPAATHAEILKAIGDRAGVVDDPNTQVVGL